MYPSTCVVADAMRKIADVRIGMDAYPDLFFRDDEFVALAVDVEDFDMGGPMTMTQCFWVYFCGFVSKNHYICSVLEIKLALWTF